MNAGKILFVSVTYIILFSAHASALAYYDSNPGDEAYWDNRVQLNISETAGIARPSEPVTVKLGDVFGVVKDLSGINRDWVMVVDPSRERVGELNGHAIPSQIDDVNGILSADDELSFIADVGAGSVKTYYVYFTEKVFGVNSSRPESDLSFDYDGGNNILVENSEAFFEGFNTGYFTLYRFEPKGRGFDLPQSPLGLDYGYAISSATSNESFVRYNSDWSCSLASEGPVRVGVECDAGSENFDVSKSFTFYAKSPFYDTLNTITKKKSVLSGARWVIYDVVKPRFKNESGGIRLSFNGSGENKVSSLVATDLDEGGAGGDALLIFSRGDADLFFDDRDDEYDLFSSTVYLGGDTAKSVRLRHAITEASQEQYSLQEAMFSSPLSVKAGVVEESVLTVVEPNLETVYDTLYDREGFLSILASINEESGSEEVSCEIRNSFGDLVYSDIILFDDGTHGDGKTGDGLWTNTDQVRFLPSDPTGVWSITCTEKGSQSIPTKANNTFYIVYDGGYRRIEFFNIYCRSGERYKHNPARVRAGETAELHICVMNTGNQDEKDIRVTIPSLPKGWKLTDVSIDDLVKGDEYPTVMRLSIPEDQQPVSEKLELHILADNTLAGVDSLLVDVVAQRLSASVDVWGESLLVRVLDEDKPVPQAAVTLRYPSSGRIQSAKTDSSGVAEIPAIGDGDILIEVSAPGYNSTSLRINVSPGKGKSYWFIVPVVVVIVIIAHMSYTHDIKLSDLIKRGRK